MDGDGLVKDIQLFASNYRSPCPCADKEWNYSFLFLCDVKNDVQSTKNDKIPFVR